VRLFLPWYLVVLLTMLAASECGSLQMAASNIESLQRQRDELSGRVSQINLELNALEFQRQCASDPRDCQME